MSPRSKPPARSSRGRPPRKQKDTGPRPKKAGGGPPNPKKLYENAAALALARQTATLALDKKALNVSILDVRGMTSYADYLVLASGESDRQVTAIADHIDERLKAQGIRVIGSEGRETGTWVLLDYGEVVVHLFLTDVRSSYDLDGLWADAPCEKVA